MKSIMPMRKRYRRYLERRLDEKAFQELCQAHELLNEVDISDQWLEKNPNLSEPELLDQLLLLDDSDSVFQDLSFEEYKLCIRALKNYRKYIKEPSTAPARVLDFVEAKGGLFTVFEIGRAIGATRREVTNILRYEEDMVLLDKKKELYFYAPIYPLSKAERSKVRNRIFDHLLLSPYFMEADLEEEMRKELPEMYERLKPYLEVGIGSYVAHFCGDSLEVRNHLIVRKNSTVSYMSCYEEWMEENKYLSLDHLEELSRKLDCAIPFATVLSKFVRISDEQFVSRKLLNFPVEEIDALLLETCKKDYKSLDEVIAKVKLPKVGCPWNTYLLESYLQSDSRVFKLLNLKFSPHSYVGAMVKRDGHIQHIDDLIYHALKDNGEILTEKEARAFLIQKHYLTEKDFISIDRVLEKVNAELA